MDNNINGALIFVELFKFLYIYYFPRLAWARLILNLKKYSFFIKEINVLDFIKSSRGVRLLIDKVTTIAKIPILILKKELSRFLYILLYINILILRRTDLVSIIKLAIINKLYQIKIKGKTIN